MDILKRMELLLAELSDENKGMLFTEIEIAPALKEEVRRIPIDVVAQTEEEI